MDEYIASNRRLWNDWTSIHEQSAHYDLAGFKAGKSSLTPVDVDEVGPVAGKSLLHLQCHFGKDTLSWARLGATVTGADFSDRAVALARALSADLGIPATFVCANLYDLPTVLEEKFDIVFTGGGALLWLPDLPAWGRVVAHFLKPGGTFYVRDIHPVSWMFEDGPDVGDLQLTYSYFQTGEPLRFDVHGSYAEPEADYHSVEYSWNHSLSATINALLDAGLRLEFLHEFPYTDHHTQFRDMEQDADGWWRLSGPAAYIPLMFSLKATAPE
jgi:SAM-dependent methyltransferase